MFGLLPGEKLGRIACPECGKPFGRIWGGRAFLKSLGVGLRATEKPESELPQYDHPITFPATANSGFPANQ
jgi:hypothetical protein